MPKISQDKTFIEKNIMIISASTLGAGVFFMFFMPFIMSRFHFYPTLQAPNEVGDAFGGVANPVVTLIGVFLTFLVFYMQYMASERQNEELEKQKRAAEARFIKDSINNIKNDIMVMRYTQGRVTYSHSEAIWQFMIDNVLHTQNVETTIDLPPQQYFQIAYLLTLFEPLITEIQESYMDDKEKLQVFQNLEGLFEASFAFILRLEEKIIREGKERQINGYVRRKIIVPVKKIKMLFQGAVNNYKENEKDILMNAMANAKIKFIKHIGLVDQRANIRFFKNYQDYVKSSPTPMFTEQEYNDYFNKGDQITKLIIQEPVRLLMRMDFLKQVMFDIPMKDKICVLTLPRQEFEEYTQIDLAEMKIDKDIWRDKFVGKFVYDSKSQAKFLEKFAKMLDN
jgi:hypothetical protein